MALTRKKVKYSRSSGREVSGLFMTSVSAVTMVSYPGRFMEVFEHTLLKFCILFDDHVNLSVDNVEIRP
jgi:hypothetical protein